MNPWPTKKLGEIAQLRMGETLIKKDLTGDGVPVYSADSLEKPWGYTSKNKLKFRRGAIVIGARGTIGSLKLPENNYFTSTQTTIVVEPNIKEVLPEFLFYFLNTLNFRKAGTGIPMITIGYLKTIKIPLPPLNIQQKIVERLDAIKKAQELNDKQIVLADELFQSLLHRELDPKGKNWEIKKLRDVIDVIESGSRPKGGAISFGIPSLGVEHINDNGLFNIDKIKYIPSDFFKNLKRGKIKKLDILIAKDGATTGKTVIVDNDFPFNGAAVNEHLFIIRGNPKIISQRFLFYTLFESRGKKQILKTKHGAAQGGIDQSFVNFVKIPLPPLETQRKIVEKLSAVQEYKKKLLNQKQKLQELFESVLNKSFKGQL